MIDFSRRRPLLLWQFLFITAGTSWIWAPQLNHLISYRTSLISQYETAMQPYALLFRLSDLFAALLLGFMAGYFIRKKSRAAGYLLVTIAVCSFLDPILTTSCNLVGQTCVEYFSPRFLFHAIESVTASAAILALSLYDIHKRQRLTSALFVAFQLVYGMMSLAEIATHNHFNTLSQIIYQAAVIVWLAWYCRDNLTERSSFIPKSREATAVRYIAAGWGFLNGFLAIIVSFYHGGIFGRIQGLYFANGSELLAQYGVVVGVIMLYLSRHLLRGEERARQIFLLLVSVEILKYAVITPQAGLLAIYFVTFCALFVLSDDFTRGIVPMRVNVRLKEAGYLMVAISGVGAGVFGLLYATHSRLTANSIDHFYDYTVGPRITPHFLHRSAVVAHLITVFIVSGIAVILWTLFRPIRPKTQMTDCHEEVRTLLQKYPQSPEDFFKLWPTDKDYFWSAQKDAFIAYKIVGPIVFALPDPIAKKGSQKRLVKDFIAWAKAHRLTVCFLPIYTEKSHKMYDSLELKTVQIGSSATINIKNFTEKTFNDKWWRWQKNRARKAGYNYAIAQPPHSRVFIKKLQRTSDKWLSVGDHIERGFALGYFSEDYMQQCTIHYLENEKNELVAFTNQLPQLGSIKSVGIDLLRYNPDANNTMPVLLGNIIENVHQQGFTEFDLGFVPFAAAEETLLKIARTLAGGQFSSAGLEQFKNKFDPVWQPTYLAYDGDIADFARIAINLERALKVQ